ncbi:hypothetical protein CJ030_MR0G006957 [Morella rubra]|uniref:WEB family protein, chloroplastic n=1 Tax=Morella rubra TaxID=262757 RepID=A0A6A1UK69_9ROSI|nr:hypothetical protein CJ030_MR0G006957 [Morella rubra]
MQQQRMGHLEDELRKTKEQLFVTEKERDRALHELKHMKKVAGEANIRLSEASSAEKVAEVKRELNSVQDSLAIASEELKIKENHIESLKLQLEKAKVSEKGASLNKLKGELGSVKSSEANAMALLSESNGRIQELEAEVKKGKESDTKTFDSLVAQTKQLEQTKILLEESKLEISSLRETVKHFEGSSGKSSAAQTCMEDNLGMQKALESLKSELLFARDSLADAQEGEKIASLKGKTLVEEMELLKNELRVATEAEENVKKAMDDLALALKEVATEANLLKEKLAVTEAELEYTKGEAEDSKAMLKSNENKYIELLDEARKEADRYKNTAERLRIEAEDSLLAWNGKETGFVECIKIAEEERFAAQEESRRLLELLTAAEKKAIASKEETQKVRDILKQALNEANVAKEAAGIARAENYQLKDSLAEKEDVSDSVSQENERLRRNEAAAFENIRELKRLLSETITKEMKREDKDKSPTKEHKDGDVMRRAFSVNLGDQLKFHDKHETVDSDLGKYAALGGSMFDTVDSSRPSSVFTANGEETIRSDDFDHMKGTPFEESDNDGSSRKKRAILRRFVDLIRRRSLPKKEASTE